MSGCPEEVSDARVQVKDIVSVCLSERCLDDTRISTLYSNCPLGQLQEVQETYSSSPIPQSNILSFSVLQSIIMRFIWTIFLSILCTLIIRSSGHPTKHSHLHAHLQNAQKILSIPKLSSRTHLSEYVCPLSNTRRVKRQSSSDSGSMDVTISDLNMLLQEVQDIEAQLRELLNHSTLPSTINTSITIDRGATISVPDSKSAWPST